MIHKKSNIKNLSYFTLSLITAIFIITGVDRSGNIYHQYATENESYAKLIANATESHFKQLDMILDLIGNQLVKDDNYKNRDSAKQVFHRMLGLNPSIIAYALISPEGEYLLTHLDTPPDTIPNVLSRDAARDSFLQTLQTKKLVVGRTYLLNETRKMAIPVRKAFYDQSGKPIAVMAIGLDIANSEIFDSSSLKSGSRIIHLFRDRDQYRQLYIHSKNLATPENVYSSPISMASYKAGLSLIAENAGMPIDEVKNTGATASFQFLNSLDNRKYLVSTRYIESVGLWANAYVKLNEIRNAIILDASKLIVLYLITAVVLFSLFRKIEDIENRKRKELEFAAHHDSLSGLHNRSFLVKNARLIIDHYKHFYFLLIDIDGLKLINDIHGQAFGDSFLKLFAERVAQQASGRGEAIRLSGDEFLIITDLGYSPEQMANEILSTLQTPIQVNDSQVNFSLSMGIAHYPKDGDRLSKLISRADMALHEAKKEKSCAVFFDEQTEQSFIRRALIEKNLPKAIKQNELSLVYQPQIRVPNQLFGVEALIRWNSPELGFVSPPEFIEVAESAGLMPKLGEYIVAKACKEIGQLKQQTHSDFQLSLNISAKQFLHPGFNEHLIRTVQDTGLAANEITLELTESIFVHDMEHLIATLQLLKLRGFKISMDDFGTGFSSLSMLRKIPLNEIKIDKSFVDDITHEQSAEYVAKAIISIGNQLNYEVVVAEGTETSEQVDMLVSHGCTVFQGYYFSRPLPPSQLAQYIQARRAPEQSGTF